MLWCGCSGCLVCESRAFHCGQNSTSAREKFVDYYIHMYTHTNINTVYKYDHTQACMLYVYIWHMASCMCIQLPGQCCRCEVCMYVCMYAHMPHSPVLMYALCGLDSQRRVELHCAPLQCNLWWWSGIARCQTVQCRTERPACPSRTEQHSHPAAVSHSVEMWCFSLLW